jgi:hypothetical protein
MRKRLVAALATFGLTVAGVAVAAPAQAAACSITNFSPRSVTVGLSPVTRTFGVSTTGCSLMGWDIDEGQYGMFVWDGAPQETFNPSYMWNRDAGPLDMVVTADSWDYSSRTRAFNDGFSLLRRTAWQSGTFNASPEPVRKGAPITIKGQLKIVDWDRMAYVPYAGRTIEVQFRTPTGSYRTVKKVTTDRNGWVNTTVTASTTGVWRLRYGGNSIAAGSVSTGDSVQVR